MSKKLTNKQRLFVDSYLSNGLNATQACISAGYSKHTAGPMGRENLQKPYIMEEIKIGMSKAQKKFGYDQNRLVEELEFAQQMAKETKNPHAFIKATEVKSKILGLNEPKKIDLNGKLDIKNVTFK